MTRADSAQFCVRMGHRLRARRLFLEMTQEQLAALTNLKIVAQGRGSLVLSIREALAAAFEEVAVAMDIHHESRMAEYVRSLANAAPQDRMPEDHPAWPASASDITPSDGWIEWCGGECPIPDGVRFQMRWRDGHETAVLNNAARWVWNNRGLDVDIVAYRLMK